MSIFDQTVALGLTGSPGMDYVTLSNLARQARTQGQEAIKKNTTEKTGTKRLCADCYEPIPKKRLKQVPTATRCVGCETKVEKATRSRG